MVSVQTHEREEWVKWAVHDDSHNERKPEREGISAERPMRECHKLELEIDLTVASFGQRRWQRRNNQGVIA